MAKAVYNGETIAESEDIRNIDGNWYFPKNSINKKYLKESPTRLIRADKGEANFYNIYVDDKVSWNSAWYYSKPKDESNEIKDRIGFGPGIQIEK
ncbi:MAG: DUF427 domain-containing protein [Ignavibacteriaceae bacterium]